MGLSILIPSVPERLDLFAGAYRELTRQANGKPVEVLALLDNKRRTTGAKRNALVQLARGNYISFVDDDDRVTDDYVASLLEVIDSSPAADCIVFDVMVHLDGAQDQTTRFDKDYQYENLSDGYRRKPNHIMCYRRSIATRHPYADSSYNEDDEWALRASQDIVVQKRIDKVLYHYDHQPKESSWYFKPGEPMMKMRWDVLNQLTSFVDAKRYLEIGVSNGESMRHVNVKEKWGVDPVPTPGGVAACDVFFRMTSIDFLSRYAYRLVGQDEKDRIDLAFIDGYHSAGLVYMEVEFACRILSTRGLIAIHDVGPTTEAMQSDLPAPGEWTGNVWKAVVRMRREGQHDVRVVDTDFGVAIVKPHKGKGPMDLPPDDQLTWDLLTQHREELLGIIAEENLDEWLQS